MMILKPYHAQIVKSIVRKLALPNVADKRFSLAATKLLAAVVGKFEPEEHPFSADIVNLVSNTEKGSLRDSARMQLGVQILAVNSGVLLLYNSTDFPTISFLIAC